MCLGIVELVSLIKALIHYDSCCRSAAILASTKQPAGPEGTNEGDASQSAVSPPGLAHCRAGVAILEAAVLQSSTSFYADAASTDSEQKHLEQVQRTYTRTFLVNLKTMNLFTAAKKQ